MAGVRNAMIVRTIRALRLLQTERPTLAQLAAAMGTSERTAFRYLAALEEAHIPVTRHDSRYRIEGRI